MSNPKCPKCGLPMVIRDVTCGPQDQQRFWTCANGHENKVAGLAHALTSLPVDLAVTANHIKGIISTAFAVERASSFDTKLQRSATVQRTLKARPRFKGHEVVFFETAAVIHNLLASIKHSEKESGAVKAFAQWRLDYKPATQPHQLTDTQRQILSVTWKIVTRGRITLTSHHLENKLKERFLSEKTNSNGEIAVDVIEKAISQLPEINLLGIWLDADPETKLSCEADFLDNLLRKMMGKHYSQYVIPQIEFASLLPDEKNDDTKTADFAICHPRLKQKIIVEIDGSQHKKDPQKTIDAKRDNLLKTQGYTIIRIDTEEVKKGKGKKLTELEAMLASLNRPLENNVDIKDEVLKLTQAIRYAHQVQVSLLHAFEQGLIDIGASEPIILITDLNKTGCLTDEESEFILSEAAKDLGELMHQVAAIYQPDINIPIFQVKLAEDINQSTDVHILAISFTGNLRSVNTLYIQSAYFPWHITYLQIPTAPINQRISTPEKADLLYFLNYIFRFDDFQEGQREGIIRTLKGQDTLLLLPTGAGKSLVYQLAAFLLPGITIVIDPIIALMEDQASNLNQKGIDQCISINSLMDTDIRSNVVKLFSEGNYVIAFVAPERLQIEEFRQAIKMLRDRIPVSLMVADEAHCVTEWGHTFRTSYLGLAPVREKFCCTGNYRSPLLALTGTASPKVLKDVKRELRMGDEDVITPVTFDRPELQFRKLVCKSKEKRGKLKKVLFESLPKFFKDSVDDKNDLFTLIGDDTLCGLVFCINVNGTYGASEILDYIKVLAPKIKADIYTGKPPDKRGWSRNSYNLHKRKVASQFKDNDLALLVCTSAFGMGIDKPNIRYTIHYGIPSSIEAFYQEAGRAGRGKDKHDRNKRLLSCCRVIASNDNPKRTSDLLSTDNSIDHIDEIIKNLKYDDADDITRAIYLHLSSFPRVSEAKAHIEAVIREIGDISQERHAVILNIPAEIKKKVKDVTASGEDDNERMRTEKAIHRLVLLGIVNDYTIDFGNNIFTLDISGISQTEILNNYIKYVSGYSAMDAEHENKETAKFSTYPCEQFVSRIVETLLTFVYDKIEHGRRTAIKEMVNICMDCRTEEEFRKRILDHFKTKYQTYIDDMLESKRSPLDILAEIMEKEVAQKGREVDQFEAEELRGEVSRVLADYPMFPELLMIRAISEALSREGNDTTAKENFYSAINAARVKYKMEPAEVWALVARAISYIARGNRKLAIELIYDSLDAYGERELARKLIEEMGDDLCYIPAWLLLFNLARECAGLVSK